MMSIDTGPVLLSCIFTKTMCLETSRLVQETLCLSSIGFCLFHVSLRQLSSVKFLLLFFLCSIHHPNLSPANREIAQIFNLFTTAMSVKVFIHLFKKRFQRRLLGVGF